MYNKEKMWPIRWKGIRKKNFKSKDFVSSWEEETCGTSLENESMSKLWPGFNSIDDLVELFVHKIDRAAVVSTYLDTMSDRPASGFVRR